MTAINSITKYQYYGELKYEVFTNIKGKIRNTTLAKYKPLWPLYEIISNAIHAIQENDNNDGRIEIEVVRRGGKEALLESSDVDQYPIKSFVVKDNGIGFTDKNFDALNFNVFLYDYFHFNLNLNLNLNFKVKFPF